MTAIEYSKMKWVRSKDGWLAGICQGLGDRFGIEPWILRVFWLLAVCWFGTGLFIYFVLAICLPREDKLEFALDRRLLGVCSAIAVRHNFEVGLVRFLTIMFALSSLGLACLGYVVLYFVMQSPTPNTSSTDSFEGARRS